MISKAITGCNYCGAVHWRAVQHGNTRCLSVSVGEFHCC